MARDFSGGLVGHDDRGQNDPDTPTRTGGRMTALQGIKERGLIGRK